jgi:AcrR family transcriptional regulator
VAIPAFPEQVRERSFGNISPVAISAPTHEHTATVLPPRATADGALRRVQETALALFADRGYHGVSMRELAAAAGVGTSSLYGHVASKEDLLRQLILLGHEEHRDGIRRAVLESGGAADEQLRAAVGAHVRMHATYPLLATVANNELHALGDAARREVVAVRGDAERMLLDIVERGVRLGTFTCRDPWLAMAAIGAMGIRVAAWFRPGDPYSVDDVCAEYGEIALRIAGVRG